MFIYQKYSFLSLVFTAIVCYKSKQNGCCQHKPVFVLLLLRMRFIGTCSKVILCPIRNWKMGIITIFSFELCSPP